jgi:hypothetical protein
VEAAEGQPAVEQDTAIGDATALAILVRSPKLLFEKFS